MTLRFALILVSLLAVAPGAAYATADGPDNWAVKGVAPNDVLNIRAEPRARGALLGTIPHHVDGLPNLGCIGWMTYDEWQQATLAEREKARKRVWCLTGYDRTFGWVAGWYLQESEYADDPAWTGGQWISGPPLGKWRLHDFQGDAIGDRFRPSLHLFPGAKGTGWTGCDRISFAYLQDSGFRISQPPKLATRNKCLNEGRAISKRFLAALKDVREIVASVLVLTMLDEDRHIIATFHLETD